MIDTTNGSEASAMSAMLVPLHAAQPQVQDDDVPTVVSTAPAVTPVNKAAHSVRLTARFSRPARRFVLIFS